MNKSVLIVTPYFAPQSHAAVFRAYKLAKLLPRFGWTPYVVTTDTNYLYNEDHGLLEALPAEVKVIRARYVEPTLRGVRMALGGKDRTFAAIKRQGAPASGLGENAPPRPGLASRVRDHVLQRWAHAPDAHWTWYGPAVSAARRLIRLHEIPLVLTSANPYTSHRIGRTLQREGCRWVADLRDPHTYSQNMCSPYAAVFAGQRRLEREAALHADAVTVASSAIGMILADTYGEKVGDRTRFIPTGLDEALLPPRDGARPRPFPYLLFSGEFLPDYGSEFLQIFAAALGRPDVKARGLKLLIVGRSDVNVPRAAPVVRRLGLEPHVEFLDHVPQAELYRLLAGAEAGVLLSARHFRWWCLYAKLVDYLAMRKPVVAVLPDPSEARTRLSRAGLGVFLDGPHEACVASLVDFLAGRGVRPRPVHSECDRYLASRQVGAFVEVFESVTGVAGAVLPDEELVPARREGSHDPVLL